MTGEFFAVIMEGTQFERDVGRQRLPDETVQVSLYQLELCTRAIMNRRLEPARKVLELAASDEENNPPLLRGVDQLKELFPNCVQQDVLTHGRFLYDIRSAYIQERGYDMVKIRTALSLQDVEPEGEDDIAVEDPMADDDEAEESDDDTHTASPGRFTVENHADRRVRYLCSTMSECSSPRLWQRLHHFDDSCSEANEEEG